MAAAMASSTTTTTSSATTHILQRLLHPTTPRQPPFPHFFFSRSIRSPAAAKASLCDRHFRNSSTAAAALFPAASPLPSHSALFSSSTHSSCSPPQSAVSPALTFEDEEEEDEEDEYEVEEGDAREGFSDDVELDSDEEEDEEEEDGDGERVTAELEASKGIVEEATLPKLSVKEKKELASYAHGLGDKLKSQLVGKSGVTANVATSFIETLEKNELLKIKIHRTCPGEMEEVVEQLEKLTGSIVVGQIGRTVIIYRPSISKMKAEEKKRQDRKMYVRKAQNKRTFRPPYKVQHDDSEEPRTSGRGRRGNSRFL